MQVNRLFTCEGQSPYASINFTTRSSKISNPNGSVVFEMAEVNVPENWDQTAVDVLAQKYLRHHSVNRSTENSLQRSTFSYKWAATDSFQKQIRPDEDREIDSREAFHRMIGCWTSWGMKLSYFTTDADAQAFYDELSYMVAAQIFAPNSPQWFNTGVSWAYGYSGRAQGHWHVDPFSGVLELSPDSYTYPASSACFIQSIDDNLVEEGGIMDTWVREARIFKYGGGCASGDSKIILDGHGPISLRELHAFATKDRELTQFDDKGAYVDVTDQGLYTFSFNSTTGQFERDQIKRVWAYEVDQEDKMKVSLDTGARVVTSAWHPFMVWDGSAIVEKRTDELVPGDLVISPNTSAVAAAYTEPGVVNYTYELDNSTTDASLTVDKDLAWLCGYFMGDGSCGRYRHVVKRDEHKWEYTNTSVRFCDETEEPLKNVQRIMLEKFEAASKISGINGSKDKELTYTQKNATAFFSSAFGESQKTYTLSLPTFMRVAAPEIFYAFVAGLVDSYGSVSSDGKIEYATVSAEFAKDLAAMLSFHGLGGGIEYKRDGVAVVTITPKSVLAPTIKLVTDCMVHPRRIAASNLHTAEKLQRRRYCMRLNNDVISKLFPGINGPSSLKWAVGETHFNLVRLFYSNLINPYKLARILEVLPGVDDALKSLLKNVIASAAFVKAVKPLGKDVDFYDLTVDKNNNYLAGERGLVVIHNSGINFSSLRAKNESLSTQGVSSGVMSFLKVGDVAAGSIKSGGISRRAAKLVVLDADHPDILDFVNWKVNEEHKVVALTAGSKQMIQAWKDLIACKGNDAETKKTLKRAKKAGVPMPFLNQCLQRLAQGDTEMNLPDFDLTWDHEGYHTVSAMNANNSVRVTDEFMEAVLADRDWELRGRVDTNFTKKVKAKDLFHQISRAAWFCADPGLQFHDTINNWHTGASSAPIRAANPCAEYNYIDNSACNLASINLVSMVKEDGTFDVDKYVHACRLVTLALEITVAMSQYPTKDIAWNSYAHRTLGLGYANLGSLLMRSGIPYDSIAGRAYAAGLTAIMTAASYKASAEIAAELDPCLAYDTNKEDALRVLRNHRNAAYGISVDQLERLNTRVAVHGLTAANFNGRFGYILNSARRLWDEAIEMATAHGLRNMQTTLLAPTGCVVPETLVITDAGIKRIARIGDVAGEQWQDASCSVATPEGPKTATKFFVNGVKPTLRVTTKHGYDVQATHNHQLKVVDKTTGAWVWKRMDAIHVGDVLPVMLHGLIGEPRAISLSQLPDLYKSAKLAVVPPILTPELAEIVGYFMGDGSLHEKGLRFAVSKDDSDVRDHLVSKLHELFGVETKVDEQDGCWSVHINSVPAREWWEANGFAKNKPSEAHVGRGYNAHVPDAILESNDPEIYAAFVRGVFEAGGAASSGGFVASKDAQFLSDLRVIGAALGLVFKTRPHQSGLGGMVYQMRLADAMSSQAFCDSVGFIGARKNAILRAYVGTHFARMKHDRRRVFVGSTRVLSLTPFVDADTKRFLYSCSAKGHLPFRVAAALSNVPGCEWLKPLLRYFYTEVVDITDGGERETYDLSVPENVTYTANGFISHNTIGLVMSCDTTGVEPDFALVKFKKLAGGGYFKLVNGAVPTALKTLGYKETEIEDIIDYVFGEPIMKGHTDGVKKADLLAAGYTEETLQKWDDAMKAAFDPSYVLPVDELIAKFGSERVDKFILDVGGRGTVEGAPGLKTEHLPVFDCAVKCGKHGTRAIKPEGHIRMMAEIQPFLSGAISKTINMAADVTVEDIERTYLQAWTMGLKAVAVYRDGSKMSQPLSTSMALLDGVDDVLEDDDATPMQKVDALATGITRAIRMKLPHRRGGYTQAVRISGNKLYLRTGEYADGTLGEIFLDTHKEGATFRSLLNSFAIAISIGLQYGVPLEEYCDAFLFTKFEPHGGVQGHDLVKRCTSMLDFIFRDLAITYLGRNDLAHVDPDEVAPTPTPSNTRIEFTAMPTSLPTRAARTEMEVAKERGYTGDMCPECGHFKMVRNGVCLKCTECGATTGCS